MMNIDISLEGRIDIRLSVDHGRVGDVEIRSTRNLRAVQALEGKPPEQGLASLPMLFSVCGYSQLSAGIAALRDTDRQAISPETERLVEILATSELLQEHATQMLLVWPPLFGHPAQPTQLRQLLEAGKRLRRALVGERTSWFNPGLVCAEPARIPGLARQLVQVLSDAVFQQTPADWLSLSNEDELLAWCRQSPQPVAQTLRSIHEAGLAGLGSSTVQPLPSLSVDQLHRLLEADRTGQFAATPSLQGHCFETGPLARQAEQPLVAALLGRHGNGLLSRFAARLVEVARLATQLPTTVGAVAVNTIEGRRQPTPTGSGSGVGIVEASRGRLIHRVEIADGVTRRYQILAPTEWNFHPRGPFARGVEGLPMDHPVPLETRVRLLVSALDPCVAYRLIFD